MWNLWNQTRRYLADENEPGGGGGVDENILNTGLDSTVPEPLGDSSNEPKSEPEVKPEPTDPPEGEPTDEPEKPESKGSLLERLWSKVKGGGDDTNGSGEDAHSSEIESDISDTFTEAALAAGWKEEDIVEFAGSYTNEELDEMIPHLGEVEEETEEVSPDEPSGDVDTKPEPEKGSQEKDESLADRVTRLEKEREQYRQEVEQRKRTEVQQTVNSFFDETSKDFPVFGQTKDLPVFPKGTPQAGQYIPHGEAYHARMGVLRAAQAFSRMGMSDREALQEGLTWYKGKNLEKDLQRKLVRDLKKQEQRVSPRRRERSTPQAKPTSRAALIQDLPLRAGIE